MEIITVTRPAGEMPVHRWRSNTAGAPSIVVVHEIFGIEQYIIDVAERLVEAGYNVAVPELYWQTEPGFVASSDDAGLQEAFAVVARLDAEAAIADVAAAVEHLATTEGAPVGVLGFCLGGTLAVGAAIAGDPAACVAYYGSGVADMIDAFDQISCPTLLQYGNADEFIPAAAIDSVNAAIDGRTGFTINVENAGHAFDNHTRETFYDADAAQVAWAKTMAFLNAHLMPPPTDNSTRSA